ncbi:Hypothetical_protein [Hexamita inflata]|uniref:Hypothetical_protein n=1 Tax=Hexamita inflata TaxID=28002 RepID=A0AA86QT18_9EUKA|nr:Hypothetical protein HINF_LOCUS50202 [Hexamita inflata]
MLQLLYNFTGFLTTASLCESNKRCRAQELAALFYFTIKTDLRDLLCDSREVINISQRPPRVSHTSRQQKLVAAKRVFSLSQKNSERQFTVLKQVGLEINSRVSRRWVHSKPLLVKQEAIAACFGRRTTCVTHYASVILLAITFQTHSISTADEFSLRV